MQTRLARALLAVLILSVACACEVESGTTLERDTTSANRIEARVVRIVDGDTIIIAVDGREDRLRYIGIDAPESVTPDQPVECFGPESAEENARLLAGGAVTLEADREDQDRFGRLLRYVYVPGPDGSLIMVNEALVAGGYAEAGSFPPNDRYHEMLQAAEQRARARGAGLWSAC